MRREGFSAWKVGLNYYLPLIVLGGVLLLIPGRIATTIGAISLLAGLATLAFFRDPKRAIPALPGQVVSPADGTIVAIEDFDTSPHYDGPCKRISIFLSVFNVHVNRAPAAGTVTSVRYGQGGYVNAMRSDSSDLNESNAIAIETDHGPMTVRQISGAVARRIVCIVFPGDVLRRGEHIGMIKFGSRTELYLPPSAQINVRLRDKVRGGQTVLAQFHPSPHEATQTPETAPAPA